MRREVVLVGGREQHAWNPHERVEEQRALRRERDPRVVAGPEVERHAREDQLERGGAPREALGEPRALGRAEHLLLRVVGGIVPAAEPPAIEEEQLEVRAPLPAPVPDLADGIADREHLVPDLHRGRVARGLGLDERRVPVVMELVVVIDRAESHALEEPPARRCGAEHEMTAAVLGDRLRDRTVVGVREVSDRHEQLGLGAEQVLDEIAVELGGGIEVGRDGDAHGTAIIVGGSGTDDVRADRSGRGQGRHLVALTGLEAGDVDRPEPAVAERYVELSDDQIAQADDAPGMRALWSGCRRTRGRAWRCRRR